MGEYSRVSPSCCCASECVCVFVSSLPPSLPSLPSSLCARNCLGTCCVSEGAEHFAPVVRAGTLTDYCTVPAFSDRQSLFCYVSPLRSNVPNFAPMRFNISPISLRIFWFFRMLILSLSVTVVTLPGNKLYTCSARGFSNGHSLR